MPTLTFHRATSGKLVPCRATVRACPKGEHITLDEQQQAFLRESFGLLDAAALSKITTQAPAAVPFAEFVSDQRAAPTGGSPKPIEGLTFPPVVVQQSPLNQPELASANFRHAYWALGAGDSFEIADTYYEEVYVETVNVRAVLAEIFRTQEKHIPADLLALATSAELRLDQPGSWQVTRGGYYDDEYTFEAHWGDNAVQAALSKWWWAQPNANDHSSTLAYCRAKGLDTTDLTPIEALRAQLRRENPGRTSAQVESATGVEQRSLYFSQVDALPGRLAEIEARPAKKPAEITEQLDPIVGVVYPTRGRGRQGERAYALVDGFHRFKGVTSTKKRTGEFLVLTHDK